MVQLKPAQEYVARRVGESPQCDGMCANVSGSAPHRGAKWSANVNKFMSGHKIEKINYPNMKTKLSVLFAIAFMTACQPIEQPPINKTIADDRFSFVEIDGCEYVMSHVYMGNSITHKGNCKNPIHTCK